MPVKCQQTIPAAAAAALPARCLALSLALSSLSLSLHKITLANINDLLLSFIDTLLLASPLRVRAADDNILLIASCDRIFLLINFFANYRVSCVFVGE